jgi:hypothetical protein
MPGVLLEKEYVVTGKSIDWVAHLLYYLVLLYFDDIFLNQRIY